MDANGQQNAAAVNYLKEESGVNLLSQPWRTNDPIQGPYQWNWSPPFRNWWLDRNTIVRTLVSQLFHKGIPVKIIIDADKSENALHPLIYAIKSLLLAAPSVTQQPIETGWGQWVQDQLKRTPAGKALLKLVTQQLRSLGGDPPSELIGAQAAAQASSFNRLFFHNTIASHYDAATTSTLTNTLIRSTNWANPQNIINILNRIKWVWAHHGDLGDGVISTNSHRLPELADMGPVARRQLETANRQTTRYTINTTDDGIAAAAAHAAAGVPPGGQQQGPGVFLQWILRPRRYTMVGELVELGPAQQKATCLFLVLFGIPLFKPGVTDRLAHAGRSHAFDHYLMGQLTPAVTLEAQTSGADALEQNPYRFYTACLAGIF